MNKPKTFAQRVNPARTHNPCKYKTGRIFLITGKDSSGRAAWYYVRISATKSIRFEKLNGADSLNLNDWGEIIRSGFGKSPQQSIRKWAEDELGFSEC